MLKSIQSLRGIFAFFIFLHHVGVFAAGGDSGVSFFFILSGFVLCDGYQQKFGEKQISYGAFIKKRIAKIYPLHVLCFIGAFILTLHMEHNPLVWLANLLLLQSWSPDANVHFSANVVSWFLSAMLFLYLLFPFIVRLANSSLRRFFISSLTMFIIYFIAIQFVPSGMFNNIIYINPLFRIPDFVLGILLWQMTGTKVKTRDSSEWQMNMVAKSVIELSAVALFILTSVVYNLVSLRYGVVSLWWPVSIALISVFSLFNAHGGIVSRFLQIRPLVSFGNISFSFYMVHVLVIDTARRISGRLNLEMSDLVFIPVVFVITVLVAYVVWRYFERPVTRRLLNRSR